MRDPKRRVVAEGSFEFLTLQISDLHKALLAFQARTQSHFDKINGRHDKTDGRLDKVDGRLDRVEKEVRALRHDMPGIVGDAVRDALRERPRKTRKTS